MELQRAWRRKQKEFLRDLEEIGRGRQQILDAQEHVRDSPWSDRKNDILHALDDGMARVERSEARTRQLLEHVERHIR